MTERRTILTVLYLLGAVAVLLVAGALLLTWLLVTQAGRSGAVDPVAVGAVGAITTLAGTTIGALGAMLVSTRSAGAEPAAAGEPPVPPA